MMVVQRFSSSVAELCWQKAQDIKESFAGTWTAKNELAATNSTPCDPSLKKKKRAHLLRQNGGGVRANETIASPANAARLKLPRSLLSTLCKPLK